MCEHLDFLSMATVLLRVRLHPAAVVALMVLRRAPEGMEVYELQQMGGLSQTVAYRTLRYMAGKDLVRDEVRKDAYRRRVQVWRLTGRGRRLVDGLEVMYRKVVEAWQRRWSVQQGGKL